LNNQPQIQKLGLNSQKGTRCRVCSSASDRTTTARRSTDLQHNAHYSKIILLCFFSNVCPHRKTYSESCHQIVESFCSQTQTDGHEDSKHRTTLHTAEIFVLSMMQISFQNILFDIQTQAW